MIDVAFVRRMARYNRWQNANLYGAASLLGDAERQRPCGAFFGSIQGTLSHLMWADRMWMSRFAGTPRPEGGIPQSPALYPNWEGLKDERIGFDGVIVGWADGLDAAWLAGDLTWYSGDAKRDITKPKWVLVTHFFNHQTHHRGQVHCLLTQAGAKPAATDLPVLPE